MHCSQPTQSGEQDEPPHCDAACSESTSIGAAATATAEAELGDGACVNGAAAPAESACSRGGVSATNCVDPELFELRRLPLPLAALLALCRLSLPRALLSLLLRLPALPELFASAFVAEEFAELVDDGNACVTASCETASVLSASQPGTGQHCSSRSR